MSQDPMITEDLTPEDRARMAGAWLRLERLAMGWRSQEAFAIRIRKEGKDDETGPVLLDEIDVLEDLGYPALI